jgi:aspartate racemase
VSSSPAGGLTRIGLLGGMSWQSSAVYYRRLNELVQQRVGGQASAPLILWSVDFAQIEAWQRAGDWDAQGRLLGEAAAALQGAGAQAVALATNTLHIVASQITERITVPFIDLIDVTAAAVEQRAFSTVGLLATGYTMTSDLYPSRLVGHGTQTLVPDEADRETVHRIIYAELVHGIVRPESKAAYLDVVRRLVDRGAQAVILGCTEIELLLRDGDAAVPLLDTTELHCLALADVILDNAPATKQLSSVDRSN